MAYFQKEYRPRISLGQGSNPLTMLIIINLVMFVLLSFVKVFFIFLYRDDGQADALYNERFLKWFVLPSDMSELARRPWTDITYMFSHVRVFHILGNTLWLWAFGYILQDLTGNRKISSIFLYGGLGGALFFLLAFNLLNIPGQPQHGFLLGASAGIMAIAIATTIIAPGYRVFPMLNGGIPLWIITVLYLIIDFATIPYDNAGGHIAHLGGAFMGLVFMIMLRRGYDWSEWINNLFDWFTNLFNPDKPKKGKDLKKELFYKSSGKPYKKTLNVTQQRVDDILDKINQKGYHYLTEEEKELLKRASQEDL